MQTTQTVSSSGSNWKRWVFGKNPLKTLTRICVLILGTVLLSKYVFVPIQVEGVSMFPTYMDGTINFINRLAIYVSPVKRGDIVAIHEQGKHYLLLKRIIALPGETVEIKQGVVLINGKPLDERAYVKARQPWHETVRTLGPDQFFVIGDNRSMLQSMHVHGEYNRHQIIGKIMLKKGLNPAFSHLSEIPEPTPDPDQVAMR